VRTGSEKQKGTATCASAWLKPRCRNQQDALAAIARSSSAASALKCWASLSNSSRFWLSVARSRINSHSAIWMRNLSRCVFMSFIEKSLARSRPWRRQAEGRPRANRRSSSAPECRDVTDAVARRSRNYFSLVGGSSDLLLAQASTSGDLSGSMWSQSRHFITGGGLPSGPKSKSIGLPQPGQGLRSASFMRLSAIS